MMISADGSMREEVTYRSEEGRKIWETLRNTRRENAHEILKNKKGLEWEVAMPTEVYLF